MEVKGDLNIKGVLSVYGVPVGASGITTVAETDGNPPTFTSSALIFDSASFYLSPSSTNQPIVSFRGTASGGGGSAIDVDETDGSPSFPAVSNIIFDSSTFYLSPNSAGSPVVSFRGSTSSSGGAFSGTFSSSLEWQVFHNLATTAIVWDIYNTSGEAILPYKVSTNDPNTTYFYFSLATAGTAVLLSSGGIVGSGGVTDHGALTGLADDDHPQYILTNGTRKFSGTLRSSLHVEEVVVAQAFYLTPGSGGEISKQGNDVLIRSSDGIVIIDDDVTITGTLTAPGFNSFYAKMSDGTSFGESLIFATSDFVKTDHVVTINETGIDHSALANLTVGDPHTQYVLKVDQGPGFYGVIWSDGTVTKRTDRLSFNGTEFYLDGMKPTLNIREAGIDHNLLANLTAGDPHTQYIRVDGTRAFTADQSHGGFKITSLGTPTAATDGATKDYVDTTVGPGFYGIYVRESDGNPPTFVNDTITFDSQYFYITSAGDGNKPLVSLRPPVAGASAHSALTGLSADDHPQYSLVDGTRAFTGVVSGITPTAAANLATKDYVDATVGPGFYGVYFRESDGTPPTFRNDTLIFDSEYFYLQGDSVGKPIVSFRPPATVTDHGALTGLSDDDHPQYSLVDGTRAFTGVVSGITPTASANLATKGYVDTTVGPGFYGIYVRESDGNPPTFRNDTVIFDSSYFYLHSDSVGKPIVSLREVPDVTGITSVSASWKFDTSTVAADPGSKKFRLNSATLSAVTAIYINDTTNEGFDINTLAGFLSAGQSIYIQQTDDAGRAALFSITSAAVDGAGFWTIPVTAVADGGTLYQNGKECRFIFTLSTTVGADHGLLTGLGDDDHPQYLLRTQAAPGFYGISFRESDGNPAPFRNDTLIFDSDYFYLQGNSVGKPIVSLRPPATVTAHSALTGLLNDDHTQYSLVDGTRAFTGTVGGITPVSAADLTTKSYVDGLAATGIAAIGPGFYGVFVKESRVDATTYKNDTLIFDSAAFYVNPTSVGKPMVSLRANPIAHSALTGLSNDDHLQYSLVDGTRAFTGVVSGITPTAAANLATKEYVDGTVGPGFYGVIWSDGAVTKKTDRLSFNDSMFYLDGSKPTLNIKESGISHSLLASLTADDHTQYIRVDGTRPFTGDQSLGGFKLTNVGTPTTSTDGATKGYVDGTVGPGFYGVFVRESDGNPPTFRNDTVIFDSDYFYLQADSVGKPIVSLRPPTSSGGVSDHGALTGLLDDDHPQYSLVDGTRAFTGVVSGITPTVAANLATKGYVDSAAGAGFYGVVWSDGTKTKRTDRLSFNGSQFYLEGVNPTLNAKESGIDHNLLANLTVGDPHTQYILASGTRKFTGTLRSSLHVEDVVVAQGFYLTTGSGGQIFKDGDDITIKSTTNGGINIKGISVDDGVSGPGGGIVIAGGNATDVQAGSVSLTGGYGFGSTPGGNITIESGGSDDSTAGNIGITAQGSGTGVDGTLSLQANGGSIIVNATLDFVVGSGNSHFIGPLFYVETDIVSFGNKRLENVGYPLEIGDAVNLRYLDDVHYLTTIQEDPFPTLGGNLHLNQFSIVGDQDVTITALSGAFTLSGGSATFSGLVLENVGTPLIATDAATKGYVDSASGGGPGFYGIYIKETNSSPPTYKKDTIIFDSSAFYLNSNSKGQPIVSFRYSRPRSVVSQFTTGAKEWQVPHNLNSTDIVFAVYDNRQIALTPGKADMSNPNTAFFYFATNRTGKAVLITVGT